MPKGIADGGIELNHIPVYRRKFKRKVNYFGRLGISVPDRRIVEIDQALQQLKEQHPGKSLSALVCDAIVTAATPPPAAPPPSPEPPDDSTGPPAPPPAKKKPHRPAHYRPRPLNEPQLAFLEWCKTPRAQRPIKTYRALAKELGVTSITLSRWKSRLPAIKEAVSQEKAAYWQELDRQTEIRRKELARIYPKAGGPPYPGSGARSRYRQWQVAASGKPPLKPPYGYGLTWGW